MPLLFRRLLKLKPQVSEPRSLAVDHAGQRFPVALRRSPGARRLTLRVSSATGNVVLTAPEHATLRSVQAFADAHGGWIAARLARVPERIDFVPDASLPVRGVAHRIVHYSAARGASHLGIDEVGAPILAVTGEAAGVPGRVRRFLAAEAGKDLRSAVDRHTASVGLAARRIAIRDTRSRWGSCSSKGTLSFSWRLIMAPPFVLDYLAAHEVAHLKEMNHSQRFWRLLREICPSTEEAELWLKRNGTELHRYG